MRTTPKRLRQNIESFYLCARASELDEAVELVATFMLDVLEGKQRRQHDDSVENLINALQAVYPHKEQSLVKTNELEESQ